MTMHIVTASILDVSNAFQYTNVPIHEIICVSPPPYYIDWFERYYPNVNLNRDDGPFFLQCINWIQGTKPAGRQRNRLLDAVVTILKCNKTTIDNSIYIKVFSEITVSYHAFSTEGFLDTTNNETAFT